MRILVHDYVGYPFPADLCRCLARRGHTVFNAFAEGLLNPQGSIQLRSDDPPGLSFLKIPISPDYRANKYNFLKRRRYEVEYGRRFAGILRQVMPDVILSGDTPTEPQWTMMLEAKRLDIPVISWVQDFYGLAVANLAKKKMPVLGRVAGWWYQHLDKKCLRNSAAVVAISDDFLPTLAGYGVENANTFVIPNWAPLDELPTRPRNNQWSRLHGLDDKFVFLYTGTLAMKHNPRLLQQLALSCKEDPQVQVVVVSEGPGAEFLAECRDRESLSNLSILPFQNFSDIPEVMASADVLMAVLEPEAGTFSVPSKVLSYHAAGRAILASIPSENAAARLITSQGSGLCVAPGDSGKFIAAAQKLRNESALRQEMGDRGRKYAETEFDIQRIAEQFEAVFTMAMGNH